MAADGGGARLAHGGGAPPPNVVDPFAVDEGPMRRQLLKQIAALEREISRFAVRHCPFDAIASSPHRGPGMLTNAQLEEIRDELVRTRSELHDRVVRRSTDREFGEEPEPVSFADRLRILLRRLIRG